MRMVMKTYGSEGNEARNLVVGFREMGKRTGIFQLSQAHGDFWFFLTSHPPIHPHFPFPGSWIGLQVLFSLRQLFVTRLHYVKENHSSL
ncbi:hypothetical protein SDJN03_01351, partial [Cucurbita argyrosperma subsp. sororia]